MIKQLTIEDLRNLSVRDRLKLIEQLWLSLENSPDSVGIPDWHRAELEVRLAAHERAPATPLWTEVRGDLIEALRQ